MEILFILVAIILIKSVTVEVKKVQQKVKLAELPVKRNPSGYFNDKAFTEVYYSVKANK